MIFQFKAKKMSGEEIKGTREASDRFALAREMRDEGLVVIYATEQQAEPTKKFFSINITRGRVRLKDKIAFAGNLSSMLGAGLSLSRALSVLSRQTSNKYFKQVITEIDEKIRKGDSFSRALSSYPKVFPEIFVAMIEAAEESGKLPEALKLISEQLEKSYGLRRKIVGAMIYPSVILVAIIIIGILMMIFLVPTLSTTFKEMNVPLPFSTRLVIGLSDFLVAHYLLVAGALLVVIGLAVSFFKQKSGQRFLSYLALRLPFVKNLTHESNTATVLRTISSLVSAGVGLSKSLEITTRVVQNYYYRQVLIEALTKVEKGIPLSAVFEAHQNIFPILAGEMTTVGEETGQLAGLLLKGAEFFEGEIDQVTKNISTVIEPVLMIIVGVAVGLFAISMIGPMYSLSSAIK